MDIKLLKSGSDIRGVATSGYGEDVQLTDEVVEQLVNAFVVFIEERMLIKKEMPKIAIGHDSRLSSEHIKEVAKQTLKRAGCEIYDCSLISTPAIYKMSKYRDTDVDGAIMITASHHPVNKNGFKFFTKNGGCEKTDIDIILQYAEQFKKRVGNKNAVFKKDFCKLYSDELVSLVRLALGENKPLEGLKIVVDASNGAGGFFVDKVLIPLGANTIGSIFLEPDGRFPNHQPNPEDKNALSFLVNVVKDNNADLGIIFDTDVDRCALIDSDGNEINRNKLIALVSAILLKRTPGATIVTDSVTSTGLSRFIRLAGGVHHRYKRGYKNVINEAKALIAKGERAVVAMETSGHCAFYDNDFIDDGAYLAIRLIIEMVRLKREDKKICDMISTLEIPAEEREVRLRIMCEDFHKTGETILEKLKEFSTRVFELDTPIYEGVRAKVDYAKGWFLARLSVHDPIIVINFESEIVGGAKLMAKVLDSFFSGYKDIDRRELTAVSI
ncbi:MAG: phosphomannomutase/phosphoglucomutase [Firmicutes bacterium]|nr:phosphomannomutase/phosphoglucomutase [Bacillota bacterium]MCL2256335.1 phosphomannomutase/phosphoglucomutase [Bacillota bacterium]